MEIIQEELASGDVMTAAEIYDLYAEYQNVWPEDEDFGKPLALPGANREEQKKAREFLRGHLSESGEWDIRDNGPGFIAEQIYTVPSVGVPSSVVHDTITVTETTIEHTRKRTWNN